MAPRPNWRGHLRLSLVSCPVCLYVAISPRERVSFHLLNPKTNNRIQMRPIDSETGAEVPRDTLVYGFEFEKGRYVVVTKDELDQLKIESSETIDLEQFVQERAIDPIYFDTPYYLVPDGNTAMETYRVVHQAMRNTKMAGVGRLALSTREHPVVVSPRVRGMLLTTLRPAQEVRSEVEFFRDIDTGSVDKEMVQLAEQIIQRKAVRTLDLKRFAEDRYQAALRQLVESKIRGERPIRPKAAPRPSNVINLMDALRRSLEGREVGGSAVPGKRPAASSDEARSGNKSIRGRRRRAL
jgi:DNA end-binding protein Ku